VEKKRSKSSSVSNPKVVSFGKSSAKKHAQNKPEEKSPGYAEADDDEEYDMSDEGVANESEEEQESELEDNEMDISAQGMNTIELRVWEEEKDEPPALKVRTPKTKKLPNDTSGWSPFAFFQLFLTKPLTSHIVKQTNMYAKQSREEAGLSAQDRGRDWVDVNYKDIYIFFAILLVMALAPLPSPTEEVHGLATDSVTTLIDAGGVRKGSVVFFDRWFTSPLLLLELLDRGIYGVGTVMLNRSGLPTDLKMLKCTNRHPIEAVEMHLFQAAVNLDQEVHQLYAVSWMDKKPVSFVGSAFGLKTTTCQRTCKATGTR
jgi:hypothetical protein